LARLYQLRGERSSVRTAGFTKVARCLAWFQWKTRRGRRIVALPARDPLDGEDKAERIEHTWAYREVGLLQVSKWLGHSSVKVTEKHYAFQYADDLEKQLAKSANP